MINEFKKFILRGNVLDLAVAVIIGAAFGKIITSLVNDILMPPIGLLLGNVDFSNLYVNISGRTYANLAEAKTAGAATINYGIFLNNVIDLLIVASVIFLLVQAANRLQQFNKPKTMEPTTKDCPYCLSKIPTKAAKCAYCTSKIE
jgi:large conductance mechanosensitive channel